MDITTSGTAAEMDTVNVTENVNMSDTTEVVNVTDAVSLTENVNMSDTSEVVTDAVSLTEMSI